ncbi:hypothetical protein GCU49_01325 [Modestobacter roseus]|nr:hypothetical protein [Modestobacter roseus]
MVLVLAVLLIGGLAVWRGGDDAAPMATGTCTVTGSDVSVTTEQAAHAATIAAVARSRGLPPRATVIALATAQQESRLRNLDYGDRDSLGLFQQRPSQGWGSPEQVQDPVYSAGKFFDGLVEVPGWETGRLTDIAQAVQRSGFPEAYQQWEPLGQALGGALLADGPGTLSCSYEPTATDNPMDQRVAAVADAVRREAGPAEVGVGGALTVPGEGWPAAHWAVASAARLQLDRVSLDGWRWTLDDGWAEAPGTGGRPLRLELAG